MVIKSWFKKNGDFAPIL